MTVFNPTRPTFFKSPAPQIPLTTTQNTRGAMIIWMSLTKPSPNGRKLTAKSGAMVPKTIPITSAITTRPNNELANFSTVNLLDATPAQAAVPLRFFGQSLDREAGQRLQSAHHG